MAKKARTPDQYDSPWKDALQMFLQAFIEFFYADIAADIDWARGYESLDKELQKIARRAKIGKRLADKLFKVWLKDGTERWLLVHIEVQGEYDREFEARMFHYNVAAYQMYNTEVISLAALCDDRADWRPKTFRYGRWGCTTEMTFRAAKLLDYANDVARLEASDNPMAAVVLANCKTRETRQDPMTRKEWKLRIIKGLYRRNWPKEQIFQLFVVVEWMMALPDDLEEAFSIEYADFEEELEMKYVTSIERIGIRKGLEQGLEQGREEGLLEGVEVALDVKFGSAGVKLLPKVRALTGVAELRKFARFLKKADTLAQVREYLQ